MQAFPNYGIGRAMKIGKEEIIGFITAIEIYLKKDLKKEYEEWYDKIYYLVSKLNHLPHVKTRQTEYDEVGRPIPRVEMQIDEKNMRYSAYEITKYLKSNEIPLWVQEFSLNKGVIILNPVCLANGEEELIVKIFENLWESLNIK